MARTPRAKSSFFIIDLAEWNIAVFIITPPAPLDKKTINRFAAAPWTGNNSGEELLIHINKNPIFIKWIHPQFKILVFQAFFKQKYLELNISGHGEREAPTPTRDDCFPSLPEKPFLIRLSNNDRSSEPVFLAQPAHFGMNVAG